MHQHKYYTIRLSHSLIYECRICERVTHKPWWPMWRKKMIEDTRVYYEHNNDCRPEMLGPLKVNGTRYCYDCGGSFKEDGKTGVSVTSKLFDEPRGV